MFVLNLLSDSSYGASALELSEITNKFLIDLSFHELLHLSPVLMGFSELDGPTLLHLHPAADTFRYTFLGNNSTYTDNSRYQSTAVLHCCQIRIVVLLLVCSLISAQHPHPLILAEKQADMKLSTATTASLSLSIITATLE